MHFSILPVLLSLISFSLASPQIGQRVANTCPDPYKAVYCCQSVTPDTPSPGIFAASLCARTNIAGAPCRFTALCCPDYGTSYVREYEDCVASVQVLIDIA